MSTLHLKEGAKIFRFASIALMLFAVSIDAATSSLVGALKANPAEVSAAFRILPAAFVQQDDLPDSTPMFDKGKAHLRWNSNLPSKRLLLLVNVRYAGTINSYCRLVTLSRELKEPKLIKVPAKENYDECAGTSEPVYTDLNGDGIDDIAYLAGVPSNRYSEQVTVPVVYLSDKNAEGNYCYSETLSHQLSPADMKNGNVLRRKIQQENDRLGQNIARCER
jgi:hypothetical protein